MAPSCVRLCARVHADDSQMTLLVLSSLLLAVAWTVEAVLLAMHEANGGSRVLLKGSSC